jgi:taurine dioxygenase
MGTIEAHAPGCTALDVRPMSGHIGAEILGVDLGAPLDPDAVAGIRAALLRWKVVFFRDQNLTQAQHVAFGRNFGEVTPAHPTLPAAFPDHPEILVLDNKRSNGGGRDRTDPGWHTDVTFVPNPPMGAILRAVAVPEYGGDTQWTNLAVAYERLSPGVRDMVDSMRAVHRNVLTPSGEPKQNDFQRVLEAKQIYSVHPVVRVHPETGEKSLFVNPLWTSHLLDVSRRESRHLLALLYEQLADLDFTVRFRWRPGSVAFWDNRCTAHLVPGDVPPGMHRSLQRITLAGDVPVGPDGFRSYAIAGEAFA